jgi:Fe2+ transport system protein B
MNQIAKMIEREVLNWSGVTVETHRFGDIEFRVNNYELDTYTETI